MPTLKLTQQEFLDKVNILYEEKYDYNLVIYNGYYHNIIIICPIHGQFIKQAKSHLRGSGCPSCSLIIKHKGNNKQLTLKYFVKKSNLIHGVKNIISSY